MGETARDVFAGAVGDGVVLGRRGFVAGEFEAFVGCW